ncbi:cytochrome P450 [Favolaschia claudopus]|uniref:Cytochrome P450 n=1 Tax=Favolaschia claudopus TaxID=2862362 RepID=A0AAW0CAU1_9AGAR
MYLLDEYPLLTKTLLWGTGLYVFRTVFSLYTSSRRQPGLPPGPPTAPFVGNAHIFPREQLQYKFTEWARQYGDIFSLKVMHMTIIVLNTPTAIKEIIDKRGASSSNRPPSFIADIVTPDNLNLGSGRYANQTWKTLRKAAVQMLHPENMRKFKALERAEAAQLMWEMSTKPEAFYYDICRFTTSFFMSVIYGIRAPRATCYAALEFTETQEDFVAFMEVGKAPPVDIFPILNWVPKRFSGWKTHAHDLRRRQESLFHYLLDRNNGCFMEEAYTHAEEWGLTPPQVLHLGGALLEGSDTSASVIQGFHPRLECLPDVQRRAQEEMDAIKLPYMQAILEEYLRFRPIAPLTLPHCMSEDETYNGIAFPQRCDNIHQSLYVLIRLAGAIMHDEKYYEEPDKFNPDRFLKTPFGTRPEVEDDPARRDNLTFGGGRRICPGAFSGRAIVNGISLAPLPFKTTIEVRSEKKREIIRRHFLAQTPLFERFEQDLEPEDAEYVRSTGA